MWFCGFFGDFVALRKTDLNKIFFILLFFLFPSCCFAVGEVVLSKDTLVYDFTYLGSYVSSRYTYIGYAYMNSLTCSGALEFLGTYDTLSYSSVDSCNIIYSDSITNSTYQVLSHSDYSPSSFTLNCQDVGGGYYGQPVFHETIRSCYLISFTLFQVDSTLCSSSDSSSDSSKVLSDSQEIDIINHSVRWHGIWVIVGILCGFMFWGLIAWCILKF